MPIFFVTDTLHGINVHVLPPFEVQCIIIDP